MARAAVWVTVSMLALATSGAAAKPAKEVPVAAYGGFAIERAEGLRLVAVFAGIKALPIRLSALEKLAGRKLDAHYNAESKSAGFEHDGRGPIGPNVGGTPLDHSDKDAPMLFELRSQYYPRYDDENRFRDRPPSAADDPLIDRIELSDRYENGPPPELPGLTRFNDLVYVDSGTFWRARRITPDPLQRPEGFLVIREKEQGLRQPRERWRCTLSVERGPYFDEAEVKSGLEPLLELIAAKNASADFGPFFTAWKERNQQYYDTGSYYYGLMSHNPRYFDVKFKDGPYQGDFLKGEGKKASFYIDSYINTEASGEAHVPVPALFAALGMKRARVTADIPTPLPFREGLDTLLYYNRVIVEAGKWRVSMSGFHKMQNGKVVTDIDLATFRPRSISLSWHDPK